MITIDNKVYRNLQEQVLKNQADIQDFANTAELLGKFGIAVVGSVATADELPNPTTYPGDYGDAYTVGTTYPYNYYIFTRPNSATGSLLDRWLNIGTFPLPGPVGATGSRGEKGERGESTRWFYSISQTEPEDSKGNEGDYFLNYYGNVYYKGELGWKNTGINLIGPQGVPGIQGKVGPIGPIGPIGPQGLKGDPAGLVNIRAIVESVDQLPAPTTLRNLSYAYLVGTGVPYTIYVQVGETFETAFWTNVGPLAFADNYVEKYNRTDATYLYRANDNNPLVLADDIGVTGGSIVQRTADGAVLGTNVGTDPNMLVNYQTYNTGIMLATAAASGANSKATEALDLIKNQRKSRTITLESDQDIIEIELEAEPLGYLICNIIVPQGTAYNIGNVEVGLYNTNNNEFASTELVMGTAGSTAGGVAGAMFKQLGNNAWIAEYHNFTVIPSTTANNTWPGIALPLRPSYLPNALPPTLLTIQSVGTMPAGTTIEIYSGGIAI